MTISRETSDLLDRVYEAALDSGRWPAAISAAARAIGFTSGLIYQQGRPAGSVNFIEYYGIEKSAMKSYQEHYAARSPWIPIACRLPDSLFVPSEHVPIAALKRTEFYADWLRSTGIEDGIGGFVRRSDAAISMFTLCRGAEPLEPGERRKFALLLPHIRRAVEIHRRLSMTRLARDGAVDALNALNIGVLLIDWKCRVDFANSAAEAILQSGDALRAIGGTLHAATPDATRQLAALVQRAVQTTARRGDDAGGVLLLPAARGKPLRVMVSPAPRFGLIEPSALVFLGDPNAASDPGRRIARLYGLTAAETRLLGALFAGQRLKDYAAASSISVNTAKFHLKNIFAKTGSTGQMDLQRLVGNDPVLHLAAARSVPPRG